MPLLADAYAEAHLDLDPLDRDIDLARAKLQAAFERFDEIAEVNVSLNTARATAELEQFERQLRDKRVEVNVEVNQDAAEQLALQLTDLDQTVRLNVEAEGVEQVEFELARLRALAQVVDQDQITVDVDGSEIASASALLATFQAQIAETDARPIEVEVDMTEVAAAGAELEIFLQRLERDTTEIRITAETAGLELALAEIENLRVAAQAVDNTEIRILPDVEQFSQTLAELAQLELAVETLDSRITIDVDTTGVEQAILEVEALVAAVTEARALTADAINIDADVSGLELALAELAGIEAAIAAVSAEDLNLSIDVRTDGVARALAEVGLLREAVNDFSDKFVIRTELYGTTGIIAELEEIRAVLEFIDGFSDLDVRLSVEGTTQSIAELKEIDAIVTRLEQKAVSLNVALRGLPQTLQGLAALNAAAQAVEGSYYIDINAYTGDALATLGVLNAAFRAVPERLDVIVDIDGVAVNLTELAALNAAFRAMPNRVETEVEVTGLAGVIKDLGVARLAIAAFPNRINTRLNLTGTGIFQSALRGAIAGFSSLAGAATTAVQGSLQGVSTALGSLSNGFSAIQGPLKSFTNGMQEFGQIAGPAASKVMSTIGGIATSWLKLQLWPAIGAGLATVVAWLVPLATGLIASAGGLLAFGAAAGVAGGGVAALALIAREGLIDNLKEQFESFKETVGRSLGSIADLIQFQFVPTLFNTLGEVVQKIAPFVEGFIRPIADSLLSLLTTIGDVAGPALKPLGEGLGQLIDTFTKFLSVAGDISVVLTEDLFGALDGLLELLGQTGIAFAPILGELLNGFESLARDAVEPFLNIIESFGVAIDSGLGQSLSNILSPIGDLAVVAGQAFAAISPFIDELFRLATFVFPPLNFDALRVFTENVFPIFVSAMERAAPAINDVYNRIVEMVDEFTSSEDNMRSIAEIIDVLIGAFIGFGEVLAASGPALQLVIDAFDVFKAASQGFINSMLDIGAKFVGVIQTILGAIAGLLDAYGAASDIPLIGRLFPGGEEARTAADALGVIRDNLDVTNTALQQTGDFIIAADDAFYGATDTLNLFGGEAGETYASLSELTQGLPPVVAGIERVGWVSEEGAKQLAQLKEQFKNTISASDELVEQGQGLSGFADFIEAETVDIGAAFADLEASITLKIDNLKRFQFVEALGFDSIAAALSELDPEAFSQAFDQFFSGGYESAYEWEGRLDEQYARLAVSAAALDDNIAQALGSGEYTATQLAAFFAAVDQAIVDGQETFEFFGESIDLGGAGTDGAIPPAVAEGIQETAAAAATGLETAMEEAFAGLDLATTIGNPLSDAVGGLSEVTRIVQAVGQDVGKQLVEGLEFSLEVGSIGLSTTLAGAVGKAAQAASQLAVVSGLLIGVQLATGISNGIGLASSLITGVAARLFEGLQEVGRAISDAIGRAIGLTFSIAVALGVQLGASTVVAVVQGMLAQVQASALTSMIEAGRVLGLLLMQGIGFGINNFTPIVAAALQAAIQAAVGQVTGLAIPLGRTLGVLVAIAIASGILASIATIQAAIVAAVSPGGAIGAAIAFATIIGAAFANSIAAGILATLGVVLAAVTTVVSNAYRIGQALGQALFLAAGQQAGIAFGQGIAVAMSAVAAATRALATTLGIATGLAYARGVQQGINSGMGGISVPTGNLTAVIPTMGSIGRAAGSAFGSGVASGIQSGLARARASAIAMAQSIAAAVRATLEISSPSKVMQRAGNEVVNGLVLGIEEATPELTAAGERMAEVLANLDFAQAFGTKQFNAQGIEQYWTKEASEILFNWNALTDKNRGKPGFTQAEDGSFVGPGFYDRTAGPTNINVEVVDKVGDPRRTGDIIGRRIVKGFRA